MKHLVKPECRHGCRFLQITPALWLCPHASYGEASNQKGLVEDARALLDRQGGYETVLARLVAEEEERKRARQEQRRPAPKVRYG